VISLIIAFVIETVKISTILQAGLPILYGGLFSVGIGFTLQVVVQKTAHPAHAAIIMSLETVFAAFGGWLLLNEHLSSRALVGCVLMLCAMIVAQLNDRLFKPKSVLKNSK
jgi:drug/metabolite transporter (DMT)-like permease